jgi:hypothetical protein
MVMNETSCSIKGGEFLEWLGDYLVKVLKGCVPWSYLEIPITGSSVNQY